MRACNTPVNSATISQVEKCCETSCGYRASPDGIREINKKSTSRGETNILEIFIGVARLEIRKSLPSVSLCPTPKGISANNRSN